jgi:hypothetical protein
MSFLMKIRRLLVSLAVVIFLTITSTGCSRQRESAAEQDLRQRVESQSGGALSLSSFSKTNGLEQNLAGMQMYTLEWEARIAVQADVWKGGNALVGYWSDFSVMKAQPGVLDSLLVGGDSKEFVKGATVVFTGSTVLQKTDNGWRPVEMTVKSSQVLNNQRSPAAQAEFDRQIQLAREATERARAEEERKRLAAAQAEAERQAEVRRQHEALIAQARQSTKPLGNIECTERVDGGGPNFMVDEFRTYRFFITGASITRELIKLTVKGGKQWSERPIGSQDVVWFDTLYKKPGLYRGSRSSLDRVISVYASGQGFDVYCSSDPATRKPVDALADTFKLLEASLDSWKERFPTLAKW